MGRGVAFQAAQKYPWIKLALGRVLKCSGNHVYRILPYDDRL